MDRRPAHRLLPWLVLLLAHAASGATVTQVEAERVCRNWLTYLTAQSGDWGGAPNPRLRDQHAVVRGDTLLGWHHEIAPRGYVIVPARRELPPIHACSETARWPSSDENPFLTVSRDMLGGRVRHLRRADEDLARSAPVRARAEEHPAWAVFDVPPAEFADLLATGSLDEIVGAGPLLDTAWHQDAPFNLHCPQAGGARTYVGCTATAAAQLMRHHRWPPHGADVYGYEWDGDDCVPGSGPEWLEADLTDAYIWSKLPAAVDADTPSEERQALANFSYEVAVACRMDFSTCGSAASLGLARAALLNHFYFAPGIREVIRFRYTDQGWFDEIRDDVDQGLPILYSSVVHTMVCDGWREVEGMDQIHLNYGWGGASDNWYTLDDIETSLNPWAERMLLDAAPDTSVAFPVAVAEFAASDPDLGGPVELSWTVPACCAGAEFWPLRASGIKMSIPLPLTDEPLTGETAYVFRDSSVVDGENRYWLTAVSATGEETWFGPVLARLTVGVEDVPSAAPASLDPPRPNPANPRAEVAFTLRTDGPARLRVHDARGRVVRTLVDGVLAAGGHRLAWDGRTDAGGDAPSGVYLLRLEAGGGTATRKLTLSR